jgi:pimeloyl-ACP methyl ester carboxylesterase
MPAVFVHGVPDTHHEWDGLLPHLSRTDVVTPDLPGFGCPVPDGFDCNKEAYAAWLATTLEAIGEPVDLVGHDWGSLLVQYVGSTRPDLVRTWSVSDGPVDTEYVWHDTAQLWQTPEVGEQVVAAMTADVLTTGLAAIGHPSAAEMATRVDDTMRASILKLYRSAVHIGAEWQPAVERNQRPVLVVWGSEDEPCPYRFGERLAQRTGGRFVLFEGANHWAPVERPAEYAALLQEFWAEH